MGPILALACLAFALPQGPPPDPIPRPPGHDFGLRWNGEIRQIETAQDGLLMWTAEDGGRIRHSADFGASWAFQRVPKDANQTLLDVWFENTNVGWACGRAGRLLQTSTGGTTWEHYDLGGTSMLDSTGVGYPAVLWRFRRFGTDTAFVAGLDTFKRTEALTSRDVGQWHDVNLWWEFEDIMVGQSSGDILPSNMEFYSMELLRDDQDPTRFVGVAAGDIWTHGVVRGLCFRTDTSIPESDGGRNWWVVLDALDYGSTLVDPWDIEFHKVLGDPDEADGYLVGGMGNQDGSFFSTDDGGATWTQEFPVLVPPDDFAPTLYGVAALPNGDALASGYGGTVWWRDASTSLWYARPPDGITPPLACIEAISGPRALVAGAFGMFRATLDAGIHWPLYMNPIYGPSNPERNWRFEDILFFDESTGFAVGQVQLVVHTTDGGLTWTRIQGGYGEPDNMPTTNLVAVAFAKDRIHGVIGSSNTKLGADLLRYTDSGGTSPGSWNTSTLPAGLIDPQITEVDYAGASVFWAVGSRAGVATPLQVRVPMVLYSSDNGRSWLTANVPGAANLTLTAAAFVSPFDGILVGYRGKKARAYRSDVSGGGLVWRNVSPLAGPAGTESRRLLDVDSRGTDLSEVYAVGESGSVFRFSPNTGAHGKFVDVPPVFDIDDMSGALVDRWLRVDLRSVSLAPGGQEILIGGSDMHHDRETTDWKEFSPDLGRVLRFDGTDWGEIGCMTNKDHRAIRLVADGAGYLLGRFDVGNGSSEFGTVGDCVLLRYQR